MMRKFVFALACSYLLVACSTPYSRTETGGTDRTNMRLEENEAVLVMTPKDGSYNQKTYIGSGALVARDIDASFSQYARLVDVSPSEFRSIKQLSETIIENDYGYIVVPTIISWRQQEHGWSKAVTHITLKIVVLDAKTGRELSANYLEAKNKSLSEGFNILNIFEDDAENPEDIVVQMADDYADTLYLPDVLPWRARL
jgi:hypothetical protein